MNAVLHLKVWCFVYFCVVTKRTSGVGCSEERLSVTERATLADVTKFATITNSALKTVAITSPVMKGKLTMNKFNLTLEERKILAIFAKCDMKVNMTAKVVYMCVASVENRLQKIQKKTGINPKDFFGLCALLNARCIYQDKSCFIIFDGGNERIEIRDDET